MLPLFWSLEGLSKTLIKFGRRKGTSRLDLGSPGPVMAGMHAICTDMSTGPRANLCRPDGSQLSKSFSRPSEDSG